jgi:hypothetical protein
VSRISCGKIMFSPTDESFGNTGKGGEGDGGGDILPNAVVAEPCIYREETMSCRGLCFMPKGVNTL